MEPTFAETQQSSADVDALRSLWISLISARAPSYDTAHGWLRQLSYFEVGKCIHATQRLSQKYKGNLRL
jgi:hypothetical protein